MGGFLFLMDSIDSIQTCIRDGVYSTHINAPERGFWDTAKEATFADYITMCPGDNVFFFNKRKVYGVGKLVAIREDCKYKNYPEASDPKKHSYTKIKKELIWDIGKDSGNYRWICTFVPDPDFFLEGVDMDDLLASAPSHFRMLRAIQGVSFTKIDDEESKALRDLIIFRNRENLGIKEKTFNFKSNLHKLIAKRITMRHNLTALEIMDACCEGDSIRHEMAIECGVLESLISKTSVDTFGQWDYVSHQVIASPFKPIAYIDKMDIFAFSYIPGYDILANFLVIELKKGTANVDAIEQIMKYVDWVKGEYALGDYSRIKAFVIAKDFDEEASNSVKRIGVRNYTHGARPAKSSIWRELRLLKYRFDADRLIFNEVDLE